MAISLADTKETSGVVVRARFSSAPDAAGVLMNVPLALPEFERACYWRAFQKYDMLPPEKARPWQHGCNRMQPLAVKDFSEIREGGMFLLLRLRGGDCLALLPLVGPKSLAWFAPRDGAMSVNVGTFGSANVEGDLPVLAWARAADPYAACREAWAAALAHPAIGASTTQRENKMYPDLFRYLGWCSWEEYRKDIGEAVLMDAARAIEESGLPIRYVLVDDGHLDHRNRRLVSFKPNEKLPRGWKPLLDMRREDKIKWMGVWLCFTGYWEGVAPDNALTELKGDLEAVKSGALLPRNDPRAFAAFYDGMIGAAARAGFDFVKVDNQTRALPLYQGMDNAAERAVQCSRALEAACARHVKGLINCMAQNAVCVFNTRLSAVSRCSEDYKLGDLARARRHLHNSYGNIPWQGQTVWGDHDMFHSNDPVSGRMMAVSKALSGGPIYLSDNPRAFTPENVWPLCYSDGELPRPLAPASPLPESLFLDPFAEAKPFRAVAPVAGECAAVIAYNLTEPEQPVAGALTAADYAAASGMMQPYPGPWAAPKEGLAVYDWYARRAARLEGAHPFTLAKFADAFFLMCPIHDGWAVIGRADKYLSPATIQIIERSPSRLVVRLKESGPLVVWSEGGKLSSPDAELRDTGAGLWLAQMPVGQPGAQITIRRS